MPAASESTPAATPAPTLPHTWRPLGTMLVGLVASASLLVAMGAAWFFLDPEIRAAFSWFQRITMVLLVVGAGTVLWGILRCRLSASDTGLVVINGYRRYEYSWAEVISIRMPNGAPWATLDLADGTARPVIGIQASDGLRANRSVREVRALLARS